MSTLIFCLHHAVFQISRFQLVKKAEILIIFSTVPYPITLAIT